MLMKKQSLGFFHLTVAYTDIKDVKSINCKLRMDYYILIFGIKYSESFQDDETDKAFSKLMN
jgi:hypothetical protein